MVARGKPAGLSEPSQFQVTLQLVEGLAGSEPGPDADGRTRPISKRNKLRQAETANQNTVLTERRVWGSPAPRPPACWACERGRTSQLRPQYSIFLFFQSGGEKCPQLKPHPFPRVPRKSQVIHRRKDSFNTDLLLKAYRSTCLLLPPLLSKRAPSLSRMSLFAKPCQCPSLHLWVPPVVETDQDGATRLFTKQEHCQKHVSGCPRGFILFPNEAEKLWLALGQLLCT